MSWFSKKKEEVKPQEPQKPALITTNPPAREVALKKYEENVQKLYESTIKTINDRINNGVFEYEYKLFTDINTGKILGKMPLKVGLKLKEAGFTVKIKTIKNANNTRYNPIAGLYETLDAPEVQIFKYLYVSWK